MAVTLLGIGLAPESNAKPKPKASEPSPWSWVDRGPKLLDASCAAPDRCVAVGGGGAVLLSVPGAGGELAWSKAGVRDLVAVTCNDARCIAVSKGDGTTAGVSKVFRSTDSGVSWAPGIPLPPATTAPKVETQVGTDVACEPTGDCVIVGNGGGIWRSGTGGESWSPIRDSSLALPYTQLACPAESRCLLVGEKGNSAVLRDRDASAITKKPTTGDLTAVACESQTVCIAADSLGQVVSIPAPFREWDRPDLLPGPLELVSLDCPAAETCVGITGKGPAMRTTARSSGEWTRRPTGTANLLALDCAGTDCAAVGKVGSWYASEDTGFRWDQVNAVAKFNGITCPAGAGSGTCVAGGMENIGKSRSAGDLWTLPIEDVSGLGIDTVSCAGFPGCLALGKDRTLATDDAGLTWQNRLPAGSVAAGPAAEACVSAEQCMGVGGGAIYTTLDGARSGWSVGSIPTAPGEMLKGIACPSATRCVVASSDGIYRGDLAIGGGAVQWSWTASDADPSDPLNGIGCASPNSCTAVGFNGQVLTTTDPELLNWKRQRIGTGPPANRPPLLTVSCPAEGICVAGGEGGYIATTTSDWANWSLEQIEGSPRPKIAGFGCETPVRCVAVGDTVIAGGRTAG